MIEVLDVSKKFRIWEDRSRDLKETTINWLRGKKRSYRELWALRGINLEIREGETVAFIGENGSGKSTLLKLLCRIYAPDEGKIVVRGKISTLLELGVGFHPDLTGEENVYLNGAMLGFNRSEMMKKFDEIVSFSEIGDFIYSPIRTYSSGMLMRLGFSVAMCVDPDILLIDEVLAVGDEAFQQKCLTRLGDFKSAGKTIIVVTHSLEMVRRFSARAILLHEGKIIIDGEPKRTIEQYHALLSLRTGLEFEAPEKIEPVINIVEEENRVVPEENQVIAAENQVVAVENQVQEMDHVEETPVQGENHKEEMESFVSEVQPIAPPPPISIREMKIIDVTGVERERFDIGETARIKIVVETRFEEEPTIGIGIMRDDQSPVYGVSNRMDHVSLLKTGNHLYSVLCEFPSLSLLPGRYIIRGHCGDSSAQYMFDTVEKSLTIAGETKEFGVCRLNHQWKAVRD